MLGWLGWPHAAVLSWSGWLFAAALLVVGGRHRLRDVAFLALVIAAMVYAGQAEILVLVGLALALFLFCLLLQRVPALRGQGPIRRPVFDLSLGVVCGAGLGAPLLLPGLQVVSGSQHAVPGGDPAEIIKGNPPLPAHNLVARAVPGLRRTSRGRQPLVRLRGRLLGDGRLCRGDRTRARHHRPGVRRRRPEVVAFGALCAAMLVSLSSRRWWPCCTDYLMWARSCGSGPFCRWSSASPCWARFGMDAIVQSGRERAAVRWAAGGFAVVAVLVAALWAFGRGDLPADLAHIRADSFWWPVAVDVPRPRRRRRAGVGTAAGRGRNLSLGWSTANSTGLGRVAGVVAARRRGCLPHRRWRPSVDLDLHPVRVDPGRGELQGPWVRHSSGLVAPSASCRRGWASPRTPRWRTASRSSRSTTR